MIGPSLVASVSAFHSHVSEVWRESDADQAYAGTYQGWPVAYIDFPVNEGDETTWGGTAALEFVQSFGVDKRVNTRASVSLADGRIRRQGPEQRESQTYLPTGGMTPLEFLFGVDVDWGRWSVAPRLTTVGHQRVYATEQIGDSVVRRTIPGYTTIDVNMRRRLFSQLSTFLTIENALDARFRHLNARAYTNPEELVGAPQNPRRLTAGFEIRIP
jgi:hypothetical protein